MSQALQMTKVLKVELEFTRGPKAGEKILFERGLIRLGRGPENDLVLAADSKVSRQHLEIHVNEKAVRVKNINSKNPVTLDGELLTEAEVRPGAVLRFGESELKFHFQRPVEQPSVPAVQPQTQASVIPLQKNSQTPVAKEASSLAAAKPSPPSSPAQSPSPSYQARTYTPPSSGPGRMPLYILVVVVLGAAYYLSQEQARKRTEIRLRDNVSTELSISKSENELQKLQEQAEKRGVETLQYKLAQEQYLKGFRDYRQGQYARAMEEFQAAISFYPGHEMARRYLELSKRKFDELIQFHMIQGKRYYGVDNYRLCMAAYSNVIKMKKDERDPIRREAVQYYQECEFKMRGKF